ncbi:MAG: hypothetical protein FGM57_00955 [Candidatus Taylorbacteria bacterium]|nr:hypothetical protein [Candidatus Taylorbacteria bacterium]
MTQAGIITNIYKDTLKEFNRKYGFLAYKYILPIYIVLLFLSWHVDNYVFFASPTFFIPLVPFFIIYGLSTVKTKNRFYAQVAEAHGWRYLDLKKETIDDAFLSERKHTQHIVQYIHGSFHDTKSAYYLYTYTVGSGKHKRTYHFNVLEATLSVQVPHILIWDTMHEFVFGNHFINHSTLPQYMRKITLEGNFSKEREVYVEKEYEIEAYQILTPDTMEYILHNMDTLHLELTQNKMFLYTVREIYIRDEVDSLFDTFEAIYTKIKPSLISIQKH